MGVQVGREWTLAAGQKLDTQTCPQTIEAEHGKPLELRNRVPCLAYASSGHKKHHVGRQCGRAKCGFKLGNAEGDYFHKGGQQCVCAPLGSTGSC